MNIIKPISVFAFLIVICSCKPIEVVVDQNKSVDFSKYSTYSFLGWQNNSGDILNDSDKESLRLAFTNEFERRGMTRVNSGGDMQISLYIIISDKSAVSGYSSHYGSRYGSYNYYGGTMGYGYTGNSFKQNPYRVGTLIMDVFDKTSKDQVWQGIASKTVTENLSKRQRTIPTNIRALMRDFPVKPE